MIGGEDTPSGDDHQDAALLEAKVERLQGRFHELFSQLSFVPAYAWAGTFAESKDGLAYIGTPPGRDKEYFAMGYGGNGITFGLIAARLITDLLLGRPNEAAAVFRFGR
jgi:glycine/D-amino acid oxidase-like deaminating enzyme